MKNKIRSKQGKKNKGSISIEAAMVLPIVCGIFIIGVNIIQIFYLHTRVQIILNETMLEMQKEVYILETLGVWEYFQEKYAEVEHDDLGSLQEKFSEYIEMEKKILKNSYNHSLETERKNTKAIDLQEVIAGYEFIEENYEQIVSIHKSLPKEGIHLLSRIFATKAIKMPLEKKVENEGLNLQSINIVKSDTYFEDNNAVIIVEYYYIMKNPFFIELKFKLQNTVYCKAFLGKERQSVEGEIKLFQMLMDTIFEGEENNFTNVEDWTKHRKEMEKVVYITKRGEKYHTSKTCRHIFKESIEIPLAKTWEMEICSYCRNENQHVKEHNHIKKQEHIKEQSQTKRKNKTKEQSYIKENDHMKKNMQTKEYIQTPKVYITKYGEVYHTNQECRILQHNIEEMQKKEAMLKGYTHCKTCKKGEK